MPGALAGYRLVDLGTLGGDNSFAIAMNDRGDVVGRAQAADGSYRGFLWCQGRMIDLGAFIPTDVNDSGQVVGHTDTGPRPVDERPRPGLAPRRCVRRQRARPGLGWGFHSTGPLPRNPVAQRPGHRPRRRPLQPQQHVRPQRPRLGHRLEFSADQSPRGILWRHGRALDVGTLGGGFTELRAINNHGEILAISEASDGRARPALRRPGVLHDLSLAGISTYGEVVDLDDRGRIAASIRQVGGGRAVVHHPRWRTYRLQVVMRVQCEVYLRTG